MSHFLVTPAELEHALLTKPVKLVCALMKNPTSGEQAQRAGGTLPQSVDFDLDEEGSDHTSGLPHSMPEASALSAYLGRLGITEETDLVVYDEQGIYCAPRVWWMLKALGHRQVTLLDGGRPAWEANGLPSDAESPARSLHSYEASPQTGWFVNSSAVLSAQNTHAQIVDARSPERFRGEAEEPRPGVRKGHIPGSVNLYYQSLLRDGKFLDLDGLAKKFNDAGVDLHKPVICTCGSGVTACIVAMAACMLGAQQVSVYDGSWSEWGADTQYPVAIS